MPIRNRDDLSHLHPRVARVCMRSTTTPRTPATDDQAQHRRRRHPTGPRSPRPGRHRPARGDAGDGGQGRAVQALCRLDAFPICLDTTDTEEIIATVKAISPVFAGINLEDISAPRCFEIEQRLRAELDIPVFHDDQHGTAIVALAAMRNALAVVGKRLEDVRLVMSGAGAAGTAILKLMLYAGARNVVVATARRHPPRP